MDYTDQAIHEAIYWWCRDEYFFHQIFSDLDSQRENLGKDFIEEKVMGYFLRQYSIRRTVKAEEEGVSAFMEELFSIGLYTRIKENDLRAIDEQASKFKKSASKESLKSALTKFAALCNPKHFIMFDTRARRGMHRIQNRQADSVVTYEEIDNYVSYVSMARKLAHGYADTCLLEALAPYNKTAAISFLNSHLEILRLRSVDKLLWFEGYERGREPSLVPASSFIAAGKFRG